MRSSSIPLPRVLLALCAALAVIGFEADIPRKIEQYHAERQWEARLQYAIKSTQYPYVYGVATLLDGDKLPEWFSVNINTFDGQEHARTTSERILRKPTDCSPVTNAFPNSTRFCSSAGGKRPPKR